MALEEQTEKQEESAEKTGTSYGKGYYSPISSNKSVFNYEGNEYNLNNLEDLVASDWNRFENQFRRFRRDNLREARDLVLSGIANGDIELHNGYIKYAAGREELYNKNRDKRDYIGYVTGYLTQKANLLARRANLRQQLMQLAPVESSASSTMNLRLSLRNSVLTNLGYDEYYPFDADDFSYLDYNDNLSSYTGYNNRLLNLKLALLDVLDSKKYNDNVSITNNLKSAMLSIDSAIGNSNWKLDANGKGNFFKNLKRVGFTTREIKSMFLTNEEPITGQRNQGAEQGKQGTEQENQSAKQENQSAKQENQSAKQENQSAKQDSTEKQYVAVEKNGKRVVIEINDETLPLFLGRTFNIIKDNKKLPVKINDKAKLDELIKNKAILYVHNGGVFKKKFDNGGIIKADDGVKFVNDTTQLGNYSYTSNMSPLVLQLLNAIQNDTTLTPDLKKQKVGQVVNSFNDMQKNLAYLRKTYGSNIGKLAGTSDTSDEIKKYQQLFANLGNDYRVNFNNAFNNVTASGISGDKAGTYTPDNLFGNITYNRTTWGSNNDDTKEINDFLKKYGYELKSSNELGGLNLAQPISTEMGTETKTGTELKTEPEAETGIETETETEINNENEIGTNAGGMSVAKYPNTETKGNNIDWSNIISSLNDMAFPLSRYFATTRANNRAANLLAQQTEPFVKPMYAFKPVFDNSNAWHYRRMAGDLNSKEYNYSSDMSLNTALKLENERQARELLEKAAIASNTAINKSLEESWLQSLANKESAVKAANANAAAISNMNNNKLQAKAMKYRLNAENFSTLSKELQGLVNNYRQNKNYKRAIEANLNMSNINLSIYLDFMNPIDNKINDLINQYSYTTDATERANLLNQINNLRSQRLLLENNISNYVRNINNALTARAYGINSDNYKSSDLTYDAIKKQILNMITTDNYSGISDLYDFLNQDETTEYKTGGKLRLIKRINKFNKV